MSDEENSSNKNKQEASPQSEEEPIIPEEEISEDKYQIQSDPDSNILSNKLIQLLQEQVLQSCYIL